MQLHLTKSNTNSNTSKMQNQIQLKLIKYFSNQSRNGLLRNPMSIGNLISTKETVIVIL